MAHFVGVAVGGPAIVTLVLAGRERSRRHQESEVVIGPTRVAIVLVGATASAGPVTRGTGRQLKLVHREFLLSVVERLNDERLQPFVCHRIRYAVKAYRDRR